MREDKEQNKGEREREGGEAKEWKKEITEKEIKGEKEKEKKKQAGKGKGGEGEVGRE